MSLEKEKVVRHARGRAQRAQVYYDLIFQEVGGGRAGGACMLVGGREWLGSPYKGGGRQACGGVLAWKEL